MKTFIFLCIFFFIFPKPIFADYQAAPPPDPRIAELTAFMDAHHFEKPYYAADIIGAADKNHIDFRLLPVIEYLESSGGKRYIQNSANPFGWNSDRTGFNSIPDAIDYISSELGSNPHYAGKTDTGKLNAYNGRAEYTDRALILINQIHN